MKKISLIVIGGFLGAGKTTSILAMAKRFLGQGLKVGVVTNDQGSNLVDTRFLESEGLAVLEVTGGCFCCNFDEFVDRINELSEQADEEQMPDVILAEPVGSCTDLIATIFRPMLLKHAGRFVLHPFSVVADPKRVKRVMMEKENSPFPSEINYLFKKQMEEADVIVLNKIDTISQTEILEIKEFLGGKYETAKVINISAQQEFGIDEWAEQLLSLQPSLKGMQDIDYQVYARAEAQLGWLNYVVDVALSQGDPNEFMKDLLATVGNKLRNQGSEIAHLKLFGVVEDKWFKLSLTSVFEEPIFNRVLEGPVDRLQMIINARVSVGPGVLSEIVEGALVDGSEKWGYSFKVIHSDSFMPGEPKPKYRMN